MKYGDWKYGLAAYSDGDTSPSEVLAESTSATIVAGAKVYQGAIDSTSDATTTVAGLKVRLGAVSTSSTSTSVVVAFGSIKNSDAVSTVVSSTDVSGNIEAVGVVDSNSQSTTAVSYIRERNISNIETSSQSSSIVLGRKKWETISTDAAVWTKIAA